VRPEFVSSPALCGGAPYEYAAVAPCSRREPVRSGALRAPVRRSPRARRTDLPRPGRRARCSESPRSATRASWSRSKL